MTHTILITGANRGIGLEFTKQYAKAGWQIFACCKDMSTAQDLKALAQAHKNISLYTVDITMPESIQALSAAIDSPIDILLNNAGYLENDSLETVTPQSMMKTFQINTVGALNMMQALIGHVAKSEKKLIASLSSSMGSISENTSGGYYSYRASKAALNMVMKSAAIDLASQHIKVLLLHPGWVKTRMGGDAASLSAQDSVAGMFKVMQSYNPKPGQVEYIRYNGEKLSW
ncbi:MAG: SDR family oxidoreductase [Proteobacteria bacterium]|nr:SDR family oxidoreductase [Pseudomonadota bacterium]